MENKAQNDRQRFLRLSSSRENETDAENAERHIISRLHEKYRINTGSADLKESIPPPDAITAPREIREAAKPRDTPRYSDTATAQVFDNKENDETNRNPN